METRKERRRGWRGVAGRGLVAGLLLTASVPPFGWWILGLAGAALLADTLVRVDGWRMRLLAGAAAGLTLYAVGWVWVSGVSVPGYAVAGVIGIALLSLASVTGARGPPWGGAAPPGPAR